MKASSSPSEAARGPRRLLVIDDDAVIGLVCERSLVPEGYSVEAYQEPRAGLAAALSGEFDVILLDLIMPGLSGLEILRQVRSAGVRAEVIIITAHSTVETAVQTMKQGAADYLNKPFSPAELRIVLEKVWERSALLQENARLRRDLELHQGFEGMIGASRPMERLFRLIQRVAPTEGTVLVSGESGTGKEMVVRAIHRLSARKEHPLLVCDCTTLAPTLLESELFGHVKGSFSGAIAAKDGLFQAAHEGTLFLDEVSNLTPETQGKLLRVLETRSFRKVGDTAEQTVDIRLLAATNRDLAEMVIARRFRADLYYRLNVVPLFVPPLRDRQGDIARLAAMFLNRFCAQNGVESKVFSPETLGRLESYRWPGNVRELRNVVERVAILCDSSRIELHHLPPEIRSAAPSMSISHLPQDWQAFRRLKQEVRDAAGQDLERRFLTEALERCHGNVTQAARDVGMQRTNFHALMRKYGIGASPEVPSQPDEPTPDTPD